VRRDSFLGCVLKLLSYLFNYFKTLPNCLTSRLVAAAMESRDRVVSSVAAIERSCEDRPKASVTQRSVQCSNKPSATADNTPSYRVIR